jgi:hypothetical protein
VAGRLVLSVLVGVLNAVASAGNDLLGWVSSTTSVSVSAVVESVSLVVAVVSTVVESVSLVVSVVVSVSTVVNSVGRLGDLVGDAAGAAVVTVT